MTVLYIIYIVKYTCMFDSKNKKKIKGKGYFTLITRQKNKHCIYMRTRCTFIPHMYINTRIYTKSHHIHSTNTQMPQNVHMHT